MPQLRPWVGALPRARRRGALDSSPDLPARAGRPRALERETRLPPSGIGRRILGAGIGILGALIITAGIAGGDGPPIVAGALMGMSGSGLFMWGWRALQERRQSVLQALNRKVLMLATRRGGVLTVTEVAAELDLSLEAAEKLMIAMDDGFRVRSDISNEGVLYYEFPEVVHQKKLRAGDSA